MKRLSKASDIWILKPTEDDLLAGAEYAALTLPWTFNRMMKNTGTAGQRDRGLNIAKGIVGQEMLRRALDKIGVQAKAEKKSHRDDDIFDFRIKTGDKDIRFDVKTVHHYTDYGSKVVDNFSPEFVIKNANYYGADWRIFFPMLVTHTQIGQEKENYVFGIASSIDPRHGVNLNRKVHRLTAFPYGDHLPFFSHKRLCLAREEARKGFIIESAYQSGGLLDQGDIDLIIIGEWNGNVRKQSVRLGHRKDKQVAGPFSLINSFQITPKDYENFYGEIHIMVAKNQFNAPVLSASKINLNMYPRTRLILTKEAFCNLVLPNEYTMYFLGWIPKCEFIDACKKYTGWVWPDDRKNKYFNQSWSQITDNDRKAIERAGFSDCIQRKPSLVNAGWMKTSGSGPGACCYVFPNTGHHGGIKETNLYILPQDLYAMAELSSYIR